MLAKKYKLPLQDFAGSRGTVFQRTPFFSLKSFPAALPYSRCGVVVSSKVFKNATTRNQLKRLLFDSFQGRGARLPVADYLVIVLPEAVRLPDERIAAEIAKLFS